MWEKNKTSTATATCKASKALGADLEPSGVVFSARSIIHRTLNQAGLRGRRPIRTPQPKGTKLLMFATTFFKPIWDDAPSKHETNGEVSGKAAHQFVYGQ